MDGRDGHHRRARSVVTINIGKKKFFVFLFLSFRLKIRQPDKCK